jgi:hypothetical protein
MRLFPLCAFSYHVDLNYKPSAIVRLFSFPNDECLSLVSITPAISYSPESMTTAINPCYIFSLIAGDDTSVAVSRDKFIADDNDTSEQLSPGVIDTGENDTGNLFTGIHVTRVYFVCKAASHVNKDAVEMGGGVGELPRIEER